ncbi:hypothetical protein AB0P15_36280 [Streptomyces sp. NPDC087917]|uniref:hypothetical protein n=1 Tax=Streptomyces sp. NPDC087917 TaxID=3155060 RepID=UPI00343C0BDE
MPLISEYSTSAYPDRGIVEVYDSDAYVGADEALARSRTQVVAGDGYHLFLHSLQPDIEVEVAIRIWDSPPEMPEGVEGMIPVSLESETGQLVVNQLNFGPAGVMDLPRPGVYEGHATWSDRQATADYYQSCLQRSALEGWSAEQIGAAWKQCPNVEKYVLDLCFVRDCEPDDEDDS